VIFFVRKWRACIALANFLVSRLSEEGSGGRRRAGVCVGRVLFALDRVELDPRCRSAFGFVDRTLSASPELAPPSASRATLEGVGSSYLPRSTTRRVADLSHHWLRESTLYSA